jgi:PAS domain S-box-containing protein
MWFTKRQGDILSFGYVSVSDIIHSSLDEMKRISKSPVEAIFLYNCYSRKKILGDFTSIEVCMLNHIAPVSGFFSYGEFGSHLDGPATMHSNASSILAFSESNMMAPEERPTFMYEIPEETKSIITLTRLIQASTKEIRALHEDLSISEQNFKSLFDNNTDFVYSTDLDGNFVSVNPTFIKTFAYSAEEIIGKPALDYIKKEDIPGVRMHFYRALKGRTQYYNIQIPNKSGDISFFQLKNVPISVNGEIVGIYGIGKNITEQKIIEENYTYL